MTHKERLITALERGVPDQVPITWELETRYADTITGKTGWRSICDAHRMIGSSIFNVQGIGPVVKSDPRPGYGTTGTSEPNPGGGTRRPQTLTTPGGSLTSADVVGHMPQDPSVSKHDEYPIKTRDDYGIYADHIAEMARTALGVFTWLMTQWSPGLPLTQALINKNSPAVALTYDVLGLAVILGALTAVVRRYIIKDDQLITGQVDTIAVSLIGAIFVVGFVVEGARILVTAPQSNPVAFSFLGYAFSLALNAIPVDWGVIYGSLWYVHAALVAALVAYLPFGKFIHVLVGPIVAALNPVTKER